MCSKWLDYNLEVSGLTREIKLWRAVQAVTAQLSLQGNTGATGTEAADLHGAASSVSGHPELCQGAHQALMRPLAQPPAPGGVQHRGPDVSRGKSGLIRLWPNSPAAAGTIPRASALPLAPTAAVASPRLPVRWQKLSARGRLWLQATASLSVSYIYIHTHMWGFVCTLSVSILSNMKWNKIKPERTNENSINEQWILPRFFTSTLSCNEFTSSTHDWICPLSIFKTTQKSNRCFLLLLFLGISSNTCKSANDCSAFSFSCLG